MSAAAPGDPRNGGPRDGGPRNGVPLDAAALVRAGFAHHRGGRIDEAAACCETALVQAPNQADALHLLGLLRVLQGRAGDGIALLRRAAEAAPELAAVWYNLGLALRGQQRDEEAIACLRRSVELNPGHAEAHLNLAAMLQAAGRVDEAMDCCWRAVGCDGLDAARLTALGISFGDAGRLDEAAECFRRALTLDPAMVDAHSNLGTALQRLGHAEEAVASFRSALALCPDDAAAHFRLGVALGDLNRLDEAIACYRAGLALAPDDANTHYNLANALGGLNRIDEAQASYRRALEREPVLAKAHWNLALARLLVGDYAEGWRGYEWRWEAGMQPAARDYGGRPRWTGEAPVAGRRLLLHAEQGFGDTIQFVRYARPLAARGAIVLLEVPAALKGLIAGMPGVAGLVTPDEALPEFDLHCPLLSLPLAFGTTVETIPHEVPYLAAPPDRVASWRARLGAGDGQRRVGIVWAGNPEHPNDRRRSMALAALAPALGTAGCRFYALQPERSEADAATLAGMAGVVDLGTDKQDFAETAAILANLDLVITVDTAMAHLAGALARPVWVLLPFAPDWRWLLGRADSPWYPTARLFRQQRPGDWPTVVERVRLALSPSSLEGALAAKRTKRGGG